ncbi:MAG: T9SS type A sorting domain-containing protein, partial [candidate division WOR-3 bacterium]
MKTTIGNLILLFLFFHNAFSQKIVWESKILNEFYYNSSFSGLIKSKIKNFYYFTGVHFVPSKDPKYPNADTLRSFLFRIDSMGITRGINYFWQKGMVESIFYMDIDSLDTLTLISKHARKNIGGNISPYRYNLYKIDPEGNIIYDYYDTTYKSYATGTPIKTKDGFVFIGYSKYYRYYTLFDNNMNYINFVYIDSLLPSEFNGFFSMKVFHTKDNKYLLVTGIDSLAPKSIQYWKLTFMNTEFNILREVYLYDEKYFIINAVIQNNINEYILLCSYPMGGYDPLYFVMHLNSDGILMNKREIGIHSLDDKIVSFKATTDNNYLIYKLKKINDRYCFNLIVLNTSLEIINSIESDCLFDENYNLNKLFFDADNTIIIYGQYLSYPYAAKISDVPTSFNEIKFEYNKIVVIPNPATDYIEVAVPAEQMAGDVQQVRIYNMLGQCVINYELQSTNNETKAKIDIRHLPAGLYY